MLATLAFPLSSSFVILDRRRVSKICSNNLESLLSAFFPQRLGLWQRLQLHVSALRVLCRHSVCECLLAGCKPCGSWCVCVYLHVYVRHLIEFVGRVLPRRWCLLHRGRHCGHRSRVRLLAVLCGFGRYNGLPRTKGVSVASEFQTEASPRVDVAETPLANLEAKSGTRVHLPSPHPVSSLDHSPIAPRPLSHGSHIGAAMYVGDSLHDVMCGVSERTGDPPLCNLRYMGSA